MRLNSFFLTDNQKEKLVSEANKFGISNSEMLRRILDQSQISESAYVFQDSEHVSVSGSYIISGNTIVTF